MKTVMVQQRSELRTALLAGDALDALAAAARIHAVTVRPNLRPGRWTRALAACEHLLGQIPERQSPGYLPRLRGVMEALQADAVLAARGCGDVQREKLHLIALLDYLGERRAPVTSVTGALIELARFQVAANEWQAIGAILAENVSFLAAGAQEGRDGYGRKTMRPAVSPAPGRHMPPWASAKPSRSVASVRICPASASRPGSAWPSATATGSRFSYRPQCGPRTE
jgi:hypothetical protein